MVLWLEAVNMPYHNISAEDQIAQRQVSNGYWHFYYESVTSMSSMVSLKS